MNNRDFAAEHEWLHRLPPGPDTYRKQEEWAADPEVRAWWTRRSGEAQQQVREP